jgi:ParB/RepB/Spo0J family partition protein
MTQIAEKLAASSNLDLRPIAPTDIIIPEGTTIDREESSRILQSLKNKGSLPDIVISPDNTLISGAEALTAAIEHGQPLVLAKVSTSKPEEENFKLLSIYSLYPHPRNTEVYGNDEDISDLKKAIEASGWIAPLVVTPDADGDYKIVHGNRRHRVCHELQIEYVRCEIKTFESEEDELRALLSGNVAREKTLEQKAREGMMWEQIERAEAQKRQKAGKSLEEAEKGDTRDKVAKRVGFGSGTGYIYCKKAVQELDQLQTAQPGTEEFKRREKLKEALGREKGVEAVTQLVKSKNEDKPKFKILDRVTITSGEHQGKVATVTSVLSLDAMVNIDGTLESDRTHIPLRFLKPALEPPKAPTSVKEELAQKQKELGLGRGEQVLPEMPRNEGTDPNEPPPMQASYTGINKADLAIALLQTSPEELFEVFSQTEFTEGQIQAIWQAVCNKQGRKAA